MQLPCHNTSHSDRRLRAPQETGYLRVDTPNLAIRRLESMSGKATPRTSNSVNSVNSVNSTENYAAAQTECGQPPPERPTQEGRNAQWPAQNWK